MDVSEPEQNVPVEHESGTVVHAPEPSSNKRDGATKRDLVKQRGEVQAGQNPLYNIKYIRKLTVCFTAACLLYMFLVSKGVDFKPRAVLPGTPEDIAVQQAAVAAAQAYLQTDGSNEHQLSYEQQLQLVANQGGQQPQQFLQQQSQIQQVEQVQVQNDQNVQQVVPAAPVQNYNIEYKSKAAQEQEKEEQKEAKAVESVMKDRSYPDSTPDKPDVPINAQFVFHTKLPKAGSTTMNNILRALSQKNQFYYAKINPHMLQDDNLRTEKAVVNWYNATRTKEPTKRIVVLKHHYPFDFAKYRITPPTFINVIREPASWFQSHYYFERNGWAQDSGDRNSFKGTEADRLRTINECVDQKNVDCVNPKWTYLEYICGNDCKTKSKKKSPVTNSEYARIVEKSKHSLLNRFLVVGILEEFDLSLSMFEKLIPEVFHNVLNVAHSYQIQQAQNSTKSLKVVKMTPEVADYFRTGPLRYETDFYQFAKAVFYKQCKQHGLI